MLEKERGNNNNVNETIILYCNKYIALIMNALPKDTKAFSADTPVEGI